MNGGYNIALNSGPSSGTDCYTSTCSAVSLAQFDLNIWKCSLGKFKSNSICSSTLDITPALSNGDGSVERNGNEITVINAYTQHDYKGPGMKADYDAIRSVFKKIKSNFSGKRIGYPKIGAGLAGGDWNQISKFINEKLIDEDHTLVEFAP